MRGRSDKWHEARVTDALAERADIAMDFSTIARTFPGLQYMMSRTSNDSSLKQHKGMNIVVLLLYGDCRGSQGA
jgi:hypothetical protein